MKTSMFPPELSSCGLPPHSEPFSMAFSFLVDQDEDYHGSLGSHMWRWWNLLQPGPSNSLSAWTPARGCSVSQRRALLRCPNLTEYENVKPEETQPLQSGSSQPLQGPRGSSPPYKPQLDRVFPQSLLSVPTTEWMKNTSRGALQKILAHTSACRPPVTSSQRLTVLGDKGYRNRRGVLRNTDGLNPKNLTSMYH